MHCVPFPVRRSTSALFYATNIVLSPVIYGVGLVGNLLLLLMLQRRFLRKESAVYVYLTGIAVVDVLSLLVRIPRSLRDMEILPINSSYSKPMAYAAWMCYGADYVFRNSSSWCLAFACIARYISARWPYSPRRFTRISSSRIAVFTLFMFSAMVNFARFFEISAIEVQGHCFPGASLWSEARTSFSRRVGFGVVYPWITACLCYIVPFILIVIFISLLSHATGGAHLRPSRVCHEALRKPRNEDQREIQLTVSVFVITMTYFALETPTIIKHVMLAAMGPTLEQNDFFYEFTLIADCLSLISCTLNFFHLSIFSHDFRKTFTRTFCFLCTRCMGDEYFEGVSCSPCCSGKEEEPVYKDKSLEWFYSSGNTRLC
ncbi:hypothetical protein CAPTEDRAFT_202379 [Capitella teleta]|uniref:G-protein coupled receptors family 1 profile domain-containing protein n=1 Tax=Capitella teleta TaxID=283909 RepID=R7TC20_CAPTE|nr:hypothetical protein CAPTEDRAFT_202379 [Capitella teleta]|eukprot:ELT91263.1 hypothetical protein CAPTEDRAFT_202379 [Capitella teleta]